MGQGNQKEERKDVVIKIGEKETNESDKIGYEIVPSMMQFACTLRASEKLLVVDQSVEDQKRGMEITFGNPKFNFTSYTGLCQMIGLLPDESIGIGPCTRIKLKNEDYIITCAHNLCSVSSLHNTTHIFEKMRIYEGREGDTWKQLWKCNVQETYVNPKYDGALDCGFDIGISRIRMENHKLNGTVKIDEKLTVDDCD